MPPGSCLPLSVVRFLKPALRTPLIEPGIIVKLNLATDQRYSLLINTIVVLY